MLEVSLTFLIITGIVILAAGFAAATLIQNAKTAPLKSDLLNSKSKAEELENKLDKSEQEKKELSEKLGDANTTLARNEETISSLRAKMYDLDSENRKLKNDKDNLNAMLTIARAEKAATEENNRRLQKWIDSSKEELKDSFASLSQDIAEKNSKTFLENAESKFGDFTKVLGEKLTGNSEAVNGIVKPVGSELKQLNEKVISLSEKVDGLNKQSEDLKSATDTLSSTLKNNSLRGKWGEEQLRKVAELAGMVEHIDFDEQQMNSDGNRPDMVIHLTGGRNVPVDSKAPMNSYMLYLDDTDEQARKKHLDEHVKALRTHIDALNKKAYWKGEDRSVEMVAMVVPYESGLSAAFSADRDIFSYAMEKNVLLLSPMTFYAFLKSVSIGWQENAMSKNAKEIAKQSKELITRFEKFFSYMDGVGKALNTARTQYDNAMSSYDKRLSVTFNRFKALSSGIDEDDTPLLTDFAE